MGMQVNCEMWLVESAYLGKGVEFRTNSFARSTCCIPIPRYV